MSDKAADKLTTYNEGDVIIEQGEESDNMFWLKSGLLVVLRENEEGKQITLGNINPGEIFGEMSFLDSEPRSATVKAIATSEVLRIPKKKYLDILKGQPQWMQNLVHNLVDRLRKTNNKVSI